MKVWFSTILLLAVGAANAQLSLDNFTFDNGLFGDTLTESDHGSFSYGNWLSTTQSNPGNPGLLTGANFDSGVANIGLGTSPVYTIGYNRPIVNGAGDDLGIVVARYTEDNIRFAVSADGQNFTADRLYGPQTAVDTGVHRLFYYGGGGPFDAELFVQPVDLSDFGVAPGASIFATRVTGDPQLDLVRVAGFVPEPGSYAVIGVGLAFLLRRRVTRV